MKVAAASKNRLVLLLCWVIFFCTFTLFTPALLDDADSVHAEVAREMLVRHDWVTLYANGIRYLEKAPLFYWSMAASYKVFGVSTAASRIPLALGVLLLALLLEDLARRAWAMDSAGDGAGPYGGDYAGLYAGLITLSSFGVFIFSRINIPDILVCCWLTLALTAFWRTEAEAAPSRAACWAFALACALNVLTKGLIGIVFPVGIVLAHLLATRGPRPAAARLKHLHLASSTLLFLGIAVPWHLLAALHNPAQGHPGSLSYLGGHFTVPLPTDGNVHGWAWFYFVNEQVLRYLNLRMPRDYDTVPLWLFLGLILAWLLPWSAFLPGAFARALPWRGADFRFRLASHTLSPQERTNLLLVLWAILPLAFFSLSTRQEYYVLPALPPMILLIVRTLITPRQTSGDVTARVLLALGSLASAASLFFLIHTRAPAPETDLASLLQQNPADYALSFGHFMDLNARSLGLFRIPLRLTAIALLGGTLGHFLLRRQSRFHAAILTLTAGTFVFLLAAWKALVIFSPTLSSAQLAAVIAPQVTPQDLIVLHGEYEAGSTLGFYLRRNDLHIVEGRSSNLWYGSFFPDAPKIFETRESIALRWRGSQRIFLWQDPSDPDRPPLKLPAPVYPIVSAGGKQILSNQPGPQHQP